MKKFACVSAAMSLVASCASTPSDVGGLTRVPDLTTQMDTGCVVNSRQPVWAYLGTREQAANRAKDVLDLDNPGPSWGDADLDWLPRELKRSERQRDTKKQQVKDLEAISPGDNGAPHEKIQERIAKLKDEIIDLELDISDLKARMADNEIDPDYNSTKELLSIDELRGSRVPSYANRIDMQSRAYMGVNIRYVNLDTNMGVTGRTYYPAIQTTLGFSTINGEKKFDYVTTAPQVLTENKTHPSRVLIKNRQLLTPTPYLGGGLRAELGIIAVSSGDVAESALSIVDNVSQVTGLSFVSQIGAFGRVVKEGVDRILSVDKDSVYRAGVATAWEEPIIGYWVLLWPQQDWNKRFIDYFKIRFGSGLTNKTQKKLAQYIKHNGFNVCDLVIGYSRFGPDNSATQAIGLNAEPQLYLRIRDEFFINLIREEIGGGNVRPDHEILKGDEFFWNLSGISWALIETEAFTGHPDIYRVPNLADNYAAIQEAFTKADIEGARKRLGDFQAFVRRSPDLTSRDKDRLANTAAKRFQQYCNFLVDTFQKLKDQEDKPDNPRSKQCSYTIAANGGGGVVVETPPKPEDASQDSDTPEGDALIVPDENEIVGFSNETGAAAISVNYSSHSKEMAPWTPKDTSRTTMNEFQKILKDGGLSDFYKAYQRTEIIYLDEPTIKHYPIEELNYTVTRPGEENAN